MKKLKNWKNACILAGIFIFASCTPHTFHTVTIALDDACTPEQQILAYEVINNRIASIWRVRGKSDLTDGKFNITHSGENALLERMLTQRGEVYITEMFRVNEIWSGLNQVFERLFWFAENTDHEPLWQRSRIQQSPSALISVPLQQVSYIDSIFNQFRHFFPANVYFAWTANPNEGFYELLALRLTARPFLLNPNSVKDSRIDTHEFNDNDVSLNFSEILIKLNEDYHNELARLTHNNIGRNIAVVLDGKVLTHPMVTGEITNGIVSITGNILEADDFLLIKSVIMGGVLDCKARIVNE